MLVGLFGLVLALAAFLAGYPSLMLARGSLSTGRFVDPGNLTLQNYAAVYLNPETYGLFATTFLYAAEVAVVSVFLGYVLALIAVRTTAPLARHMSWLVFIPYALPSTLTAIAWTLLANPNTGFLNDLSRRLTGGTATPFNIYSFAGMVFVACSYSTSLAFTFLAAALHSTDPSLEEAASMSGSNPLRTAIRVSLPMARPAIISMLALLLILGLESFDVPAFIGIPARIYVFTTQIFVQIGVKSPPDYGMAAAYGSLPLLLALVLTFYYQRAIVAPERYATISGRGYRPRRIDLRGWRWVATAFFLLVFGLGAGLPLLTLVVVSLAPNLTAARTLAVDSFSLQNYATIFRDTVAERAIRNTLTLAVLGASVAVGASFLIAFVLLRTRLRARGVVEYVLFLPFALPSIVLAVGVLWGYVSFPIGVYGTLWILGIGYVTKFLPYGLRSVSASLLQINRELEEAARVSGAGLATLLRRVVLPLALPGLVAGWCLLVVVFMREFSMSLVLWSSGSEVVTVLFWDYWTNGRWGQLGALGTLLTMASLVIVFGVRRTARLDAVAT